MNEIIITNTNGQLTVSSLQVAKDFGKRPADVHEAIKNLTAENSVVKKFFIESTYINERGRAYRCYELTRDGFCLPVMGFTGKKALNWKLKYIEAFNLMEQKLTDRNINLEEIIAKTVAVAVSETIKAIQPMLEKPVHEITDNICDPEPQSRRTHSIISKLDAELRTAVDDMILSRRYTYEDVRNFLAEQGISVSMSSIQRYKVSLYKKEVIL